METMDSVPSTAPKPTVMRPITVIAEIAAVIAVIVALLVAITHDGGSSNSASSNARFKVWEYTVPFGTGRDLDAGKDVNFFPARLDVHVGDQLVIHNHDNRSHQVGPYQVDRDETLQQTFTEKGVLQGLCTIHPSGKVEIHIT